MGGNKLLRILQYLLKTALATIGVGGLFLTLSILAQIYSPHARETVSPGLVVIGMLPGLCAVGAALFLASNFIVSLYRLRRQRDGFGHIWRSLVGRLSFSPYVIVSEGMVNPRSSEILKCVGGPGGILIYNDSAVVLEQGGRLTRVMRPGSFSSIGRFEKVHDVIDLRPMHWSYTVSALSKEGIPVSAIVAVEFQVDTGGRAPTDKEPFPATDEAIFTASTCRWMRDPDNSEDDQYFDWARRMVIGDTEGSLRGILARYPLDALVGLERPPSSDVKFPREAIQKELMKDLQKSAVNLGAQINKVRLGEIEVDERVTGKWFEAWWNGWQNYAMLEQKKGEAKREEWREKAKAQAQIDVITAVTHAFQRAVARDPRIPTHLLIMRLMEVFDRFALDPNTIIYLPEKTIGTLKSLQELIAQKSPSEKSIEVLEDFQGSTGQKKLPEPS